MTLLVYLILALLVISSAPIRAEPVTLTNTTLPYAARDLASFSNHRLLDETSVAALLDFLVRLPEADSARPDELASLKNNAADILLRQTHLPPGLRPIFASILADARQGEIWREYVIQKLPSLIMRLGGDEQAQALILLRDRASASESIHAGCALLGLNRLRAARPDILSAEEVAAAARHILDGSVYSTPNKVSALPILAQYEPGTALALARGFLETKQPIMLQVASLAVLGRAGQAQDHALLQRFANSPDIRLRTAARSAPPPDPRRPIPPDTP